MADVLISVRNASRIYRMGEVDVYALRDASLDVLVGEFLVIVGPSGSGKSTLLNLIGGMDRPTSGEVHFGGRNLGRCSDRELTEYRRAEVGFVFQFYNLVPMLTALENVQVATEISDDPMDARAALAELEQQLVLNAYDEIEKSIRVELETTVEADGDVLRATDAQVEASGARARRAEKERTRIATLAEKGSASHGQLDDAALSAETAMIELHEQEMLRAASHTLFTVIKLGPEYIDEWLGRKRIEREVVVQQLSHARFFTGVKQDALIVPRFSVLQGVGGGHYVFKVVGGELARQVVEVGLRSDLDFEIVEGLGLDERIVAVPDTEMREGDRVD